MCRTDKTDPLLVKQWVDARFHVPAHDHRRGACDLPQTLRDHLDGLTQCRWGDLWTQVGVGLCPCDLCHGGAWARAENRRERRASRRRIRQLVHRGARGHVDAWDDLAASERRRR